MHQTLHRHVAVLAAGGAHFIGVFQGLLDARDYLAGNGAAGIFRVDQIEIMRRDRHRQLVAGEQRAVPFFFGQRQMLLQLRKRSDAVFELPGGAVPVGGRNVLIGPKARSVGAEFLLR